MFTSERPSGLLVSVLLAVTAACGDNDSDDTGDTADGTQSSTSGGSSEGTGDGDTGDGSATGTASGTSASSGETTGDTGGGGVVVGWAEYIVDPDIMSPGFLEAADLDDDAVLDLVVTTLMEEGDPSPLSPPPTGGVHLYRRTGGLGDWDETVLLAPSAGLGFVNEPQTMDVNGDNVPDIVLNTGFLLTNGGTHQYLAGPGFATPVPLAPGLDASEWFFHRTEQTDLDGDGDLDLLTSRVLYESDLFGNASWELATDWYRNDGGSYSAIEMDTGHCGVMLTLYDVDGDDDEDVICPQFFGPPAEPSIVWLEQQATPSPENAWVGQWAVHVIDASTGFGFDVKLVDIDVDGQDELVYSNHNNQNNPDLDGLPSGIYAFEIPATPTDSPWPKRTIDEGYVVTAPDMGNPASQGSPGLIDVADIDGNGWPDLVTSGDGADGLFVVWQRARDSFERKLIADGNMFGQARIVDLDDDGQVEVVAAQHRYAQGLTLPPGNVRIFAPLYEE